jgi:hypothetical protein
MAESFVATIAAAVVIVYVALFLIEGADATGDGGGASPSPAVNGYIPYNDECLERQFGCVTVVVPIGFDFPFFCGVANDFYALDNGHITFSSVQPSLDGELNRIYPLVVFDTLLTDAGGIGRYLFKHHGEHVRVIEWSHEVVYHEGGSIGTYQLWLFKSGKIGMIYHVKDLHRLASATVSIVGRDPSSTQTYNAQDLLAVAPAYLFHPPHRGAVGGCNATYTKEIWHNPPNECFNAARKYAELDPNADYYSASSTPEESSRPTDSPYPLQDYHPLKVCEIVDEKLKFGSHKKEDGKKKGGNDQAAIAGGIAGGIIFLFFLIVSVWGTNSGYTHSPYSRINY